MAADLTFTVNPSSVVEALNLINNVRQKIVQGGVEGAKAIDEQLKNLSYKFEDLANKQRTSTERFVASLEQRAAAMGKTGVERLEMERERAIDRVVKKLGDEQQMIERVRAAYARMIQEEKNRPQGGGGFGAFNLQQFAGMARNPLYAAEQGAVSLLTKLGPLGIGLGVTAASLLGVGLAALKSARDIGDFGVEITNAAEKLNIGVVETQRFRIAAKMAGTDISEYDRMIRGLTEALGDMSSRGEKGRRGLQDLLGGQALLDANGQFKSMSVILPMISTALEKSGDSWKRNADLIDLFRRAGITAIPLLKDFNRYMRDTQDLKFFSPEEIEEMRRVKEELTAIEQRLERIKLLAEKKILIFVEWASKGLGLPGELVSEHDRVIKERADKAAYAESVRFWQDRSPEAMAMKAALRDFQLGLNQAGRPTAEDQAARRRLAAAGGGGIEVLEKRYGADKKALDELLNAQQVMIQNEGARGPAMDALTKKIKEQRIETEKSRLAVEGAKKAESDRKGVLEALRKLQEETTQAVTPKDLVFESQRRYAEFAKRPGVTQRDLSEAVRILGPEFAEESRRGFAKAGLTLGPAGISRTPTSQIELVKSEEQMEVRVRRNQELTGELERQLKELKEQEKVLDLLLKYDVRRREESDLSSIRQRETLTLDTSARTQLAFAQEILDTKKKYIDEQYDFEQGKLDAQRQYIEDYEARNTELRIKHEEEIGKVRDEMLQRSADLQKHQLDEIKGPLERIYGTLLTKPSDFGRVLRDTIVGSTVHAAAGAMANLTAEPIRRVIFGQTGTGGIAGVFGRISHTASGIPLMTVGGTQAVPVVVVGGGGTVGAGGVPFVGTAQAILAGRRSANPYFPMTGLGIGAPPGGPMIPGLSGGSFFGMLGGGGNAYTDASGATYTGSPTFLGSGSFPFAPQIQSLIGPGGTAGFAPGPLGIGQGGAAAPTGIRGLMGRFGLGGFGGFGGLGQLFGIGGIGGGAGSRIGAAMGGPNLGLTSGGTSFTSVMRSPGMGMLGMMLAGKSLMPGSSWAGTPMGILGGTAGGAMIGMQYGGPIGAAVGAAVGFGIGLGELVAGVEPQWKEAQRLVRQVYHIHIDHGTGQQIADIANQRYAKHVSIAVRSPEVRQMLGLYAAATGQNMTPSAMQPHGASLTESGGRLFESPSYLYGKPYSSTNLPIFGGLNASPWPSPGVGGGGPTYVSLNVGGSDTASFMTGQFVTPSFVQNQSSQALMASNGRLATSATLQYPGLVVGG